MDALGKGCVVNSQLDLTGRVVLLTGGSRGIGAAAVRALHAAGAAVFFTYLSGAAESQALCAQLGSRVRAAKCDVGDHEAAALTSPRHADTEVLLPY